MLNFFRKIRQNKMNNSNTPRPMGGYYKYALSEIALVTIGILLALQLNNWNDIQKDQIAEIQLIHKLLEDTRADSAFFNSRKEALVTQIEEFDGIQMMGRGESVDSLLLVVFEERFAPMLILGYQSNLIFNNPNSHELLQNNDIKTALRKYAAAYSFVSISIEILNQKVILFGDPIMIKKFEAFNIDGQSQFSMSSLDFLYNNEEYLGVVNLFRRYNINALTQVERFLTLNYDFIEILETYLAEHE